MIFIISYTHLYNGQKLKKKGKMKKEISKDKGKQFCEAIRRHVIIFIWRRPNRVIEIVCFDSKLQ